MALVPLLVVSGIVLLAYGFAKSSKAALVIGAILLADAVFFYVIFGLATRFFRTVLKLGS